MKIWITRQSASSIWSGGLERLRVWFYKPVYVEEHIWSDDDPFHSNPLKGRAAPGYWVVKARGRREEGSVSFGNVFGYGDKDPDLNAIVNLVSTELHKHFNNRPQEEWDDLEHKKACRIQDFLLELDITVALTAPPT